MIRKALVWGWLLACLGLQAGTAAPYPDRLVWVFGWNLGKDSDVQDVSRVLETASQHGFNGAMLSAGLDSLSRQSPAYFRRLEQVQRACESNHLELIPAVFSVGYGSAVLAENPNLAEGLPVEEAPFVVHQGEAALQPDDSARLVNGDFEEFEGNRFKGFNFHDQPGEISFADVDVKHSGRASIRFENFTANRYGHGRVMEEVRVHPRRCYRVSLWVKTEGLEPAGAFQVMALAEGDHEVAPREFRLPSTTDWRKITMLVNSLDLEKLRLYAGVWGAKRGKIWLDDWNMQEVGPVRVLRRPGTPVRVRGEEGGAVYVEGKDYAPLGGPPHSGRDTDEAARLKILPGSAIREGERLRVSWYHSMVIHEGQVTVCMAEPELYDIFDRQAKLLAERLHPRRVMLNMDEIRMGGTCEACRGRNMGELLGQCVTKEAQIIRRYCPGAEIYIWSDMFCPYHNAHGNYYLVKGDFTGSWKHVPKDIVMAVWGGAPRPRDLAFSAGEGFRTLAACYYDAGDLNDVKGWLEAAKETPNVQGFMYTPWQKKYELLGAFGELLK